MGRTLLYIQMLSGGGARLWGCNSSPHLAAAHDDTSLDKAAAYNEALRDLQPAILAGVNCPSLAQEVYGQLQKTGENGLVFLGKVCSPEMPISYVAYSDVVHIYPKLLIRLGCSPVANGTGEFEFAGISYKMPSNR